MLYDPEDDPADEELASAITHGIGAVLCLIGIPILIYHAYYYSTPAMVEGICAFGLGLLMVYFSSTIYHFATKPEAKRRLRIWDHISIFFLIAGTHTPIVLKYVEPKTAIIFLSVMWGLAITGSIMKLFFIGRLKIQFIVVYLAMGWMSIFIIKQIVNHMPLEIFWWVLGGGLAYTLGVSFYVWKKLKYHHAIWHLFVMAGTLAHFIAIYQSMPVQVKF